MIFYQKVRFRKDINFNIDRLFDLLFIWIASLFLNPGIIMPNGSVPAAHVYSLTNSDSLSDTAAPEII